MGGCHLVDKEPIGVVRESRRVHVGIATFGFVIFPKVVRGMELRHVQIFMVYFANFVISVMIYRLGPGLIHDDLDPI